MLCVSIAQTSQRLAVFDMFNASQFCDLIEVRLDRFDKAPDFHQLFEKRFKPVLVSCRRKRDGGDWDDTEEARLAVLRQAVLSKADYVEIEVEVADQIRRYGATKRVIAYTNTMEVPEDLNDIYRECLSKDPDVVKITVPTRTPEEAWPVIKLLAKSSTPTVAVGWGRGGRLLSVLGQRYKSPWTYAALERGMEAYPGMATIRELDKVFDLSAIDHTTHLLGVSGRLEEQTPLALMLNHGFRTLGLKTRCLPLDMGDAAWFKKVVDAIQLDGVLVDERNRGRVVELLHESQDQVKQAQSCDFVATKGGHWKGYSAQPRAVVHAFEKAMLARRPEEPPIEGKSILVVGASAAARGIATAFRKRNATVIVADKHNDKAQAFAQEIGARYIPGGQVYSILVDGLILTGDDEADDPNLPAIELPKSVAREGLVLLDLSASPNSTPLLEEVRVRRGIPILPIDVLAETVELVLKAFAGKSPSSTELQACFADWDDDYRGGFADEPS